MLSRQKHFCSIIILFFYWERNKIFTLLLFEDGVNEILSHVGDGV
jgi:hypothetical protein